ncbi:arsenate reductase family protein [Arcobacter sp. FWKO B]|uniref:arsenate reductase family protein n=1 Tax=Arcobacter sp. FWKO B TaxID=2593672 RepID=UPI0018A4D21E|nr:Spx/MgsR family RNA polymerase-binding regulatory protein [Arcobacter sp. FWKO B]QOG11670.1 Spx/MgsR family RNA polymerase-binding regulatory protein [Arcobacter sp. FWKO B]
MSIKIYGIKSCGSVKKALNFFDIHNISYEFIDLKKETILSSDLDKWLQFISLEKLLNRQGTTYKKLGLKEMSLDEDGIKQWLLKEQMLLKRPIIVSSNLISCGVDNFEKHL